MKHCQQQRSKKDRFVFEKNKNGFLKIYDRKKKKHISGVGDCIIALRGLDNHVNFLRLLASQSKYEEDKIKRKFSSRSLWKCNNEIKNLKVELQLEKLANEYLHEIIKKIDEVLEEDGSLEDIRYTLDTQYPKFLYKY